MAKSDRPGSDGNAGSGRTGPPDARNDDLVHRRRTLEAALAARRPDKPAWDEGANTRGMAGFGSALRLSSEFIAGIVVGAGLGWIIDYAAGTSPWGLIVFLLLGFGAGVLNVLRSAGVVAQVDTKPGRNSAAGPEER